MDYKTANSFRSFFTKLFNQNEQDYYFVALVQDAPATYPNDFSVVLYAGHQYSSFLLPLARVADAIAELGSEYRATFCEYDAGTTEEDTRTAVKLHSLSPYKAK